MAINFIHENAIKISNDEIPKLENISLNKFIEIDKDAVIQHHKSIINSLYSQGYAVLNRLETEISSVERAIASLKPPV